METSDKNEIKIDISNISNISAASKENPAVNDFINKNSKKETSAKETAVTEAKETGYVMEEFLKYPRKFEFTPAEKVKLPSNGVPYRNCKDKDVREGYVWIYPLSMKEEEILSTSKYILEGTATIMALNNCIKSNINAVDLVISDFYFLLMYLRKISISDSFNFNIKCPNCGNEFAHEIKISEQTFDELDPNSFEEPIRIDLDRTDYTVLLGLPRIKSLREASKLFSSADDKDSIGVADFLCIRTIAIINPYGEEVPKEDWKIFFNNLPHEDYDKLLNVSKIDSGFNHFSNKVTCPECGKVVPDSEIDLNTDALFRYESRESDVNQK